MLLSCLTAFALAMITLATGAGWIRGGGTFYNHSAGREDSNTVAGCGMVLFGVASAAAGSLMVRDVEPLLWVAGVAIVIPVVALYPTLEALSFERVDAMLAWVSQRLRTGADDWHLLRTSSAHRVLYAGLSVERPDDEPVQGSYREAPRSPPTTYIESVRQALARATAREWRRLVRVGGALLIPFFVCIFFALQTSKLEPLSWQVLAGCCALATLCGALIFHTRKQMQRAATGLLELVSQPRAK